MELTIVQRLRLKEVGSLLSFGRIGENKESRVSTLGALLRNTNKKIGIKEK